MNDPALPGLPHGAVKLVEWTPRWAELFAMEAARLRPALGDLAIAIEHYGSTSVPGLVAKPLLDILVGGPDATDAGPYIAALAPLGYDYSPHAGVPEHLVFGRGTARTHLVHVVRQGDRAWHRALAFRDALRANAELRDTYAALKGELAQRHGAERSRYTEAKGGFIERVLGAEPAAHHFSRGRIPVDLQRERKRLLQRDAEWAALSSQGRDVERILDYWSDDARVVAPGQPVFNGKAALRNYVEAALAVPGFHITWTTSEASLSPDGELAYLLSTNAVTLPGPGGTLMTTSGRAVTVWRREPDGEWRCVLDIWNDGPPAG